MTFQFATCERHRALEFLRALYKNTPVEDTPEDAGLVLDFVERDVIRIPDPAMHGARVTIYPSKNWHPDLQDAVHSALSAFHSRHTTPQPPTATP